MSKPKWIDQFQNHPVHQQLQALKDVLTEIEAKAGKEPSPEVTESIERLKQIRNQTETVLSTLDPFLAPMGVLNNMNSYLQQTVAHCNQYQADGNAAQLDSANNQAEACLIQLGSLLSVRSREDLEGLSEGITSFRRSVGQYHRYVSDEHEGLQAQIEDAKKQLEELNNNITAQQTRLDEVVSGFKDNFLRVKKEGDLSSPKAKKTTKLGLESSRRTELPSLEDL